MRGFNGISAGVDNYWENDALLSGDVFCDRQLGMGDKYNNYSEGSVVEGNVGHSCGGHGWNAGENRVSGRGG